MYYVVINIVLHIYYQLQSSNSDLTLTSTDLWSVVAGEMSFLGAELLCHLEVDDIKNILLCS